jgi:hypothetical protein
MSIGVRDTTMRDAPCGTPRFWNGPKVSKDSSPSISCRTEATRGHIFNSNGIHVAVVQGSAIFDLTGNKLYDTQRQCPPFHDFSHPRLRLSIQWTWLNLQPQQQRSHNDCVTN